MIWTCVCVTSAPPTRSSTPRARARRLSVPSAAAVMAAPVTSLDEDWEDFNEFKAADPQHGWTAAPENTTEIQTFASFEETLSASFPPSTSGASTNVCVRAVSERELLRDDE